MMAPLVGLIYSIVCVILALANFPGMTQGRIGSLIVFSTGITCAIFILAIAIKSI